MIAATFAGPLAQGMPDAEWLARLGAAVASIDYGRLIVGLGAVAAAVIVWRLGARFAPRVDRRRSGRPWRAFFGLCATHRLSWSDRWALWRLACRQGLDDPLQLFLDPRRFDDGAGLPSRRRKRLEALCRRLFAGSPVEAAQ